MGLGEWFRLKFMRWAEQRERAQLKKLVHGTPYVWRALRAGGGGAFSTPSLVREKAIAFVCQSGTHRLLHVDDQNKMIFYRD